MDLIKYNTDMDIINETRKTVAEITDIKMLKGADQMAISMLDAAKTCKEPLEVQMWYFVQAAWARHRAGELLGDREALPRAEAGDNQYTGTNMLLVPQTVEDLGLTYMEASRWALLAKIPDETFDALLRARDLQTFSYLYNEAKKLNPPPTPEGEYDVIVIDPPWDVDKILRRVDAPDQAENTGAEDAELDYPRMTIEEIKLFPIPSGPNCHVFLWTTQRYQQAAWDILKAWGARHILDFVWHKPGGFQPFALPQYNHEYVAYGRIGNPIFVDTTDFFTCFSAPRGKHSEKPDAFYETIARVTDGKRIDIFSRRDIEGFEAWGNEI